MAKVLRHRGDDLKHFLYCAVCALIMGTLGLFMAWDLPNTARLALHGTTTEGEVVQMHYTDGRDEDGESYISSVEYDYRFQTPDGTEYLNQQSVWRFQVEDRLETMVTPITYLESDPEVNRYGTGRDLWIDLLAWQLPGVAFCLLGLVCFAFCLKPGAGYGKSRGLGPRLNNPGGVDDYPD
jgi:hypothetical protein